MLNRVKELVKRNPGQLNVEEYMTVGKLIQQKSPCNLLIFGVGNDSSLWIDLNKSGKTIFIEHSKKWIDTVRKRIPGIDILELQYTTKHTEWKEVLKNKQRLSLALPHKIASQSWDIIFVDGPPGNQAGRMQSIYAASRLALTSGDTHVIVHDCDRKPEQLYCDTYLQNKNQVNSIHKIRHYHIKKS